MSKIVVLDYGSSNLRSVAKALETVAEGNHKITVTDKPKVILSADKVVFPGQGAIGQCMQSLEEKELDNVIKQCILKKPFLGICLGLQSLMEYSDEDGGTEGLGILPGSVIRFTENAKDEKNNTYKIPSMGWNQVYQRKKHPLWNGIDDGTRFYFVHSYAFYPEDKNVITGVASHGEDFVASIEKDNIFATQYHPEKSQKAGMQIIKNFLSI